jgi:hypothetical protein
LDIRSAGRPYLLSALSAALAFALVPAAPAPAANGHGFPRTYHLWSCENPAELARYDLVVGYPHCDLRRMRSLNRSGIFLLSPGLNSRRGDHRPVNVTYGAQRNWKGGCDRISDGRAANLGCIAAFDPSADLLHNADGAVAPIGGDYGHSGFNLADPRGRGTAEKIAKIFVYGAKQTGIYRHGWDGVYSDNWVFGSIGASWFYGPALDTDRDRRVDDAATLRRNWDTGLTRVGHLIRSY